MISILLLEDSPTDAYLLRKKLEGVEGFEFSMTCVGSVADARELLEVRSGQYDVIIFDLGLPDSLGPSSIATLKSINCDVPVIVLSGNEQPGIMEEAINYGAHKFLSKHEAEAADIAKSVVSAMRGSTP